MDYLFLKQNDINNVPRKEWFSNISELVYLIIALISKFSLLTFHFSSKKKLYMIMHSGVSHKNKSWLLRVLPLIPKKKE